MFRAYWRTVWRKNMHMFIAHIKQHWLIFNTLSTFFGRLCYFRVSEPISTTTTERPIRPFSVWNWLKHLHFRLAPDKWIKRHQHVSHIAPDGLQGRDCLLQAPPGRLQGKWCLVSGQDNWLPFQLLLWRRGSQVPLQVLHWLQRYEYEY